MDDTEDRILNATIKLLGKVGLKGATTKRIAEEAGVNEVTIFRRFKSKELLLKAAKNRGANNFLKELENVLSINDDGDVETYLKNIWINSSKMIDTRNNLIKISMEEVRSIPFEDRVLPRISEMILKNLTDYFKKQIDKGTVRNIDPEVAAVTIFSIVFQTHIMWKIYGQNPPVEDERCMENFIEIFMNGIMVSKKEHRP